MTEARKPESKVPQFVISFGVVVITVVVLQMYREEIGFYMDPDVSLSLEAGPRSYSAIHAAAHWGIESSLRLFVEAGADLDQTVVLRGEELTPLDLACKFGGPAAVDVLASNGGKRLVSHVADFEGNPSPPECFD